MVASRTKRPLLSQPAGTVMVGSGGSVGEGVGVVTGDTISEATAGPVVPAACGVAVGRLGSGVAVGGPGVGVMVGVPVGVGGILTTGFPVSGSISGSVSTSSGGMSAESEPSPMLWAKGNAASVSDGTT